MKIYTEDSIHNFNFWSGGKDTVDDLTWDEIDTIETMLDELYMEIEDVELNDFFWFERDTIAEWLGYENYDELLHDRYDNSNGN